MRTTNMLALLLTLPSLPVLAAELDMARVSTIAEFGQFNQTANLLGEGGQLIIPDTESDALMVRGVGDRPSFDIPLSMARPMYVVAIGNGRYAVADAYVGSISIVDVTTRREVDHYQYRDNFGPWHLAYYDGVIYGSDKGDRLINRFSPAGMHQLSDFVGGSGPSYLVAARGFLFVAEEGGFSVPGDDFIAWYDLRTNTFGGRKPVLGALREMTAWGDGGVCVTQTTSNTLLCGYPERDEWVEIETRSMPWGITTGDGQIWVLTRGDEGLEEPPMITAFSMVNGALRRGHAWKLRDVPNLELPRSLAFDATTRTLFVRGLKSVLAIPVVD